MRKLASIQRIINLEPIPNYDRIELATVLGWKVIVRKGEFKINDFCVYIEVDSLLPIRPEFEFLRKNSYSKKYDKYRIKLMKMANTFSYGLVLPISILGENLLHDGEDVTEQLGIIKYDPEELEQRKFTQKKKNWFIKLLIRLHLIKFNKKVQSWPNFLVKTDETRLQAIPEILDYMIDKKVCVHSKIDGMSGSYYWYKKKFGMCSRNLEIFGKKNDKWIKDNHYTVAIKYDLKNKLKNYGKNIAIQGEVIGTGIQGNKYKLDTIDFYVFQVFDIDKQVYLNKEDMEWICFELGLKRVPFIDMFTMESYMTVDWWINKAIGYSEINKDVKREGIVVRTIEEYRMPKEHLQTVMNRLSFKVINPEFLLEYEKNDEKRQEELRNE